MPWTKSTPQANGFIAYEHSDSQVPDVVGFEHDWSVHHRKSRYSEEFATRNFKHVEQAKAYAIAVGKNMAD